MKQNSHKKKRFSQKEETFTDKKDFHKKKRFSWTKRTQKEFL